MSTRKQTLTLVFSAAAILMVTMGIRQTFGLFVNPIHAATGVGVAAISFAMAIGQFSWGLIQPVAGAMADRYGPRPVLIGGLILLSLGCLLTTQASSAWSLSISLGLMAAIGSGVGSFSVLIGAVSARLAPEDHARASGVINAGGSFGQFVFAPLIQKLIQLLGWMGAFASMALMALASIALVGKVASGSSSAAHQTQAESEGGLKRAIIDSFKNRSYLLLHAGFFTCGFHIAFLVTHLPGEVNLCGMSPSVASWSLAIIGLSNVFGSLYAGQLVSRYRSKYVLAAMYGSRALLIAIYLVMPRAAWSYYLFAAGIGFTWLATVPPTASLVSKLFGTRYLATLFGLTLLSHQVGGFLGAWLGGLAFERYGDYSLMWYADMALATFAALVNLPIREAPLFKASLKPAQ